MTDKRERKVNCPTCDKSVVWSTASEFRPFCSKRCKMIDFGDWAGERHSIAGEPIYPEVDPGEDDGLQS